MEYKIRELKPSEYYLLNEFIYEAIFQRDPQNLLPRTVIQNKDLQRYTLAFGTLRDDYCLGAEVDGKIVGAVWVRNIKGFGCIDNDTPEFAISLYKEYRGQGIGTELMKAMLCLLKEKGYRRVTLAVQHDNYAMKMYEKVGFEVFGAKPEEYIMIYYF